MAASINDKLTSVRGSSNAVVTTVSSTRAIGGTSLSCVALTGWPTDTAVHFITYKKTAAGLIDKTTQCDWKGIVSGTTIGTLTLKSGTDAGNAVGDFVEMAPTASWGQDAMSALQAQHNQDGTHIASLPLTTPKITTSINDANGNEVLRTPATASAVNDITVTNAATGNAPTISATGDDTNIDLQLNGKGTGKVKLPSTNKTTDANGWTVYDFGAWKEYRKRVTFSQTIGPAGTLTLSSTSLPSDMSTLSSNHILGTASLTGNGWAFKWGFEMTSSSSALLISAYSADNGTSRTYTGFIDVCIVSA